MTDSIRGKDRLRVGGSESGCRFAGLAVSSLLAITMASGLFSTARAESIESVLPYVVDNHDRVRADEARLRAARNRAREALGDWYPTLSQTLNAGHEKQQNDHGDDTSNSFNEWDITLTQLLWDFGATNAAVDKARLQVEEARLKMVETRQSLVLEAITAYMNLIRAKQSLEFSIQSEENIRKQTGLEEALVGLGSGFSTDVLQAKSQLAGAQARRASAEGALASAFNRYKAVFGRVPDDVDALETVSFPAPFLPASLTQANDIALEMNPKLKNAILAADIAREDVRKTRAEKFTPKLEASGSRKFKKNVSGTIGSEQETLAKVEMTFDFNLGFTAVNTLKASEQDLSATTYSAADTRRTIEEQVRNAWQQLDTAKRTASHLDNQANIEAAFLELARNERQLGRRSLIDVLSGETTLINAKSDALSARTDVIIASYGLLAATGQLEYDVISKSKGIEPPVHSPSPPNAEPALPAAAPVSPVQPSKASGEQGRLYEADTAIAVARSSKDLREMMRQQEAAKAPAALSDVLLASISAPVVSSTPDLSFDTTALAAEARFATSVAIEHEFASTAPMALPAPDEAVLTDVADTAGPSTVQMLGMLDNAPVAPAELASVESESLAPIAGDIVEVAMAPIDRVEAGAVRFEGALISSIPAEFDTREIAAAPEPEAAADTEQVAARPADVPETTADAVEATFGGLFDFLEDAYQRKLDADAGHTPVAAETAVAALDPDPEVPATFGAALESTAAMIVTAPAADATPVETASMPAALAKELAPSDDVPDTLATSVNATFGNLFDFLEQAHRRKVEDEAKSRAPVRAQPQAAPQTERKAPAKTAEAPKSAQPAPMPAPVNTVLASLGSLFGDIATMDLSYRPLTAAERSKPD